MGTVEEIDELRQTLAEKEAAIDEWISSQLQLGAVQAVENERAIQKNEVELQEARKHLDELKEQKKSCEKVLSEKEAEHRQYVNEISKGIKFYESRLGLSLTKAEDHRLKFVFTKLDPKDEDRPFTFSISLQLNKYMLESCDPFIPDAASLLAETNRKNDFSGFVQIMRARFKDLVAR